MLSSKAYLKYFAVNCHHFHDTQCSTGLQKAHCLLEAQIDLYSSKNPKDTLLPENTHTHTQKERKEKLKFNPAGSDPSDIFIDKCATQSRSSLSSSGGNMVLVILGDTAVRVMIDYSQTELLLLI